MTLPEFISWQAYARAKAQEAERPTSAPLPELGALGPAGIAQAIRG